MIVHRAPTAADVRVDPSRLVFVGGLHRSGTTPLARALAEHTAVAGLSETHVKEDEGQHLQHVYPKAKEYGGPGRFALDQRSHLTESSSLVSPGNARSLIEAWTPYWDLSRPLLVEKSPPNLVMGRFLQALYPGSAFIVVVRHPIVVALSTVKWRRLLSKNFQNYASVSGMVEHWLTAHETLLGDLPSLKRAHVLRYEDLVEDPEQQLAPVQRLLGLDSSIPSGSLRSSHSDRYAQTWADMSSGSWIDRRKRSSIERTFGERVAAFGYDIGDLSYRGPFPSSPATETRLTTTVGESASQPDK